MLHQAYVKSECMPLLMQLFHPFVLIIHELMLTYHPVVPIPGLLMQVIGLFMLTSRRLKSIGCPDSADKGVLSDKGPAS